MSQKFISVSNDSSKEKSDIKNNIAGKKKTNDDESKMFTWFN